MKGFKSLSPRSKASSPLSPRSTKGSPAPSPPVTPKECTRSPIETIAIEDPEDSLNGDVGAVHQAVLDNNLERLEELIKKGVPVDTRDPHCLTPLHLACCRGRHELVTVLLQAGAGVKARTGPPHKTPLHLASAGGHLKVCELLVKRGARWKDLDDWGWTVLHEAAATGNPQMIGWICRESRGLLNLQDRLGRGPLLQALMAGSELEAVQELLNAGEKPEQEDEVGRSCPQAAILYCSQEVISLILHQMNKYQVEKEILLELAEDHESKDKVIEIINEIVK